MRRARFIDPGGSVRSGAWTDDGVGFGNHTYALDEVELLAPCQPSKIVCVGQNYRAHAEERGKPVPERPHFFLKPPNAVAGPGDAIPLLADRAPLEHEAELGVVIGEQCRHVPQADALGVVAGFTCVNDVSNREDQDVEQNWVRGKAFDHAAPLGPCIAPVDEVPDDARIQARVNGQTRQDSRVDDLIFSVPELIADLTRYVTLEPGDVISTGTPSGVGPLEAGDTVEIEIAGVGVLENAIVAPR